MSIVRGPPPAPVPHAKASMSLSAILLSQQITYRTPLSRTLELMNKLPKPGREEILAQFPVMLHSGRSYVMLKKTAPSLPDLLVHYAMDMMKMDRLECLEKLVASVKKACLLLRWQRLQIFQTSSPHPGQLGILSQWARHLTK